MVSAQSKLFFGIFTKCHLVWLIYVHTKLYKELYKIHSNALYLQLLLLQETNNIKNKDAYSRNLCNSVIMCGNNVRWVNMIEMDYFCKNTRVLRSDRVTNKR